MNRPIPRKYYPIAITLIAIVGFGINYCAGVPTDGPPSIDLPFAWDDHNLRIQGEHDADAESYQVCIEFDSAIACNTFDLSQPEPEGTGEEAGELPNPEEEDQPAVDDPEEAAPEFELDPSDPIGRSESESEPESEPLTGTSSEPETLGVSTGSEGTGGGEVPPPEEEGEASDGEVPDPG